MSSPKAVIELLAKDLNDQGGVFCPNPTADMQLWNAHPKVYLDGVQLANPLLLTRFQPNAIDRIEVIRGPQGAALYGADAVGGVVNFIMRDNFTGSETVLDSGAGPGGSLKSHSASQTLGHAWDSGRAMISLEYYDRDALPSSDRAYRTQRSPSFRMARPSRQTSCSSVAAHEPR